MSALLEVRGLMKRFGGLIATNNLDLDVTEGELHALIGPNGAGKSTAIGLISGELKPDAGTIRLARADITAAPIAARVRLGMTRSFQVTSILPEFTALENVALVEQIRAGHSFRFWREAARDRSLTDPARDTLARIGLAARAEVAARDLAHGEQRQLELAMALMTGAKLLLLDEPMAGLGATESQAMTEILAGLKRHTTILLVEHDMDAVFALADRITVLVYGQAIASGPPDAIRADPAVRAAYLGEEA
ncbi:MAG: ABC transporter ATP-binding protein [Alphaproteobacteria bacterium]|nr:ABC transporter ATP-binding protein [Alphaproteobacteria bacterium]